MAFPLFRFTLSNDMEGPLQISEPGGWDDAILSLERNQEYHSIVELYDQPLTFYGEDNENNGGIDYIRNIEQTQGVDAQITILIEISHDEGDTYETVWEGILALETAKEIDFYKLEVGINRNDFWQKFINRKNIPINLSSESDLDGETRTVINPIDLYMPSQKVREYFNGNVVEDTSISYTSVPDGEYGVIDFEQATLNEIEEKFNYPLIESEEKPFELFAMKYAGDYQFEIQVYTSTSSVLGSATDANLDVKLQLSGAIATSLTKTNEGVDGLDGRTRHSYSGTVALQKGDFVRIYFQNNTGGNYSWVLPANILHESYLIVTADTVYDDTQCDAFLIHETFNAITDRIIGRDGTFYSEYLGNTLTQIQSYISDGCGSNYAITRGLNVRGYTLAEKPIFMTFDNCWSGANPLFNLGLGYERIGSPELEVLRCEPKEFFYNETTSINLDFVNNIERSYDTNHIFKVIEIGFEKWSAEAKSGVDDPQSKRVYNTRFKTLGKDFRILSKFIGASIAIEQTRRNRVEQGKDWRMDEDIMIIAVDPNGSPQYQPELDGNFTEITNLLNADTRYNIRLSVARNFERWKSFFNGCLQWYIEESPEEQYKFASGEGNFDMTSTLDTSDCDATGSSPEPSLDEKGNIAVGDDHLFMPVVYSFEHQLTWEQYKTIRDNRNNAIGVSRTDSDYKTCFIMNLEYEITHGKGTFTVVVKETTAGFDADNIYFNQELV